MEAVISESLFEKQKSSFDMVNNSNNNNNNNNNSNNINNNNIIIIIIIIIIKLRITSVMAWYFLERKFHLIQAHSIKSYFKQLSQKITIKWKYYCIFKGIMFL